MLNSWIPAAPVTVNWAITNRCNFGCRHCYSRSDTSRELEFGILCALIEKVSRAKVFSVNFGGGEPLLRKDIYELAEHATGLGLAVSMNSNGFMIDKTVAGRLREAGFKKVGISIDSPSPGVHDDFRGMKGCHAKAVAALGHLNDAGIETSISSVVCKININDIDALVEQAIALSAGTLNFHNFKCSGLGYTNKDTLDLSPEEWKDFYLRAASLKERTANLHISLEDPIIASLGKAQTDSLVKGSVCGKLSLNIKSNGDITPCGFIPLVIGNLTTDELPEIWKNSQVLEKMRNKTPKGKCRNCSHYTECLGGCTARALALTGDLNNPDPHCWEKDLGGS
jgi:AdoMet-dependent heme synthase